MIERDEATILDRVREAAVDAAASYARRNELIREAAQITTQRSIARATGLSYQRINKIVHEND